MVSPWSGDTEGAWSSNQGKGGTGVQAVVLILQAEVFVVQKQLSVWVGVI